MLEVDSTDEHRFPRDGAAGAAPPRQHGGETASRRRQSCLAAAAQIGVLVLAVLLLDAPPFRSGLGTLTGRYDNASFNFPLRAEVARQWRAGELPLWNPYQFAGFPLLGDVTTAALYPGNLPFLFDPDGPRYRALDRVAQIHFVLAALFMYVFARALSLGRAAASLSGLVYAGNGVLLFLASRWIQAQSSAVWLPLILAAVVRAGAPRGFWLWTAIGAGAVALQTLSGYPQYSFYTGLMAGAFALVLTMGRAEDRWRHVWALLLIYVLGAALAAVQLLPTMEIVALSRRGGTVSLKEFLLLPSGPNVLQGLVIPRLAANLTQPYFVMGGAFAGTLAVVLAIEGARSTRRVQLFLTGALVVTFLLALGPFTMLGELAYQIPGLNAFRYPFKHLLEVVFCLAALAGFGAQAVLDGRRGARTCVAAGAVLAVCLAYLFLGPVWHWAQTSAVVGAVLFASLILLQHRRTAIAVALASVWLGLAGNRDAIFFWDAKNPAAPPGIVETLAPLKTTILGPRYAAAHWLGASADAQAILALDYPTEFRIPSVHGTSPFLWGALREALLVSDNGVFTRPRIVTNSADQTLDVLGVRYLGSARAPLQGTAITGDTKAFVVERPSALPPIRFVDRAQCMAPEKISAELHRRRHDFAAVALLDCAGKPALPKLAPALLNARVRLLDGEPGFLRMRVRLRSGRPGMLIVSQSDMPGWHARIDDKSVPIYRAYGLVQGLVVPPGLHSVELEYLPDGLINGGKVSLAALLAMLGVGALAYRGKREGGTP